jgi:hypothetical protein
MDPGRRRLAGSRYIFCLLGASEKDDAGGGVASRCLGCLVVWSVPSCLPMRHASISGHRHSKDYRWQYERRRRGAVLLLCLL